MQIYVRVPLRKRRGLIVTLSCGSAANESQPRENRNRKEKIKFITNLSIETANRANGDDGDGDAASYRFRHSIFRIRIFFALARRENLK